MNRLLVVLLAVSCCARAASADSAPVEPAAHGQSAVWEQVFGSPAVVVGLADGDAVDETNAPKQGPGPGSAREQVGPMEGAVESGDDGEAPGSPVPEPATLFLVGSGIVGLAVSSRRWRRGLPRSGS